MRCEEYRAALLAGEETAAEAAHVERCAACRAELGRLLRIRRTLADPVVWEQPADNLRERTVGELADRRPPRLTSRRWRVVLAAAAVAVIVAAASFVAITGGASEPDWEVAIDGTGPAPQAEGTIKGWNTPAGSRVALDVTDLEPAPDGFYYELWFSDGDRHVSAGTFTDTANVELWAGVSRRGFPRLWITLEPTDSDSTPSGRTVMDTDPPA